jgi:hypothetical protein
LSFKRRRIFHGDGGQCCAGHACEPSTPGDCEAIGGDYKPGGPTGVCFITQVIMDYLDEEHTNDAVVRLMAGGTYSLLYEAGDEILQKSDIRGRSLELYRKHGAELLKLTRENREIRRHVLYTFFKLAAFSRIMLRFVWGGNISSASCRFTSTLHKDLYALLFRLEAAGLSDESVSDSRLIMDEAQVFVGRPISAIVQMIGLSCTSESDSP